MLDQQTEFGDITQAGFDIALHLGSSRKTDFNQVAVHLGKTHENGKLCLSERKPTPFNYENVQPPAVIGWASVMS